jgi:hypothetical protein
LQRGSSITHLHAGPRIEADEAHPHHGAEHCGTSRDHTCENSFACREARFGATELTSRPFMLLKPCGR